MFCILRLGACSGAVSCAVASGAGAEPEGPTSDVCSVGGAAGGII